jgi:hypothetical protein
VIDAPVDVVSLGVGTHILQVPTGYIAWPAGLAEAKRWVRVTLSERPSAKPLVFEGLRYGDGRGFASPFKYGETEDYIARLIGAPLPD